MKATLTIFTPAYNRAYTLHKCYESLKKQTNKDFEWLIIDDGSTDKTPEIINELIDKILVHQQTKVNGKKYQQIDIYYSGVGIISVSANEYDFEKEFQNILKNNRKTA